MPTPSSGRESRRGSKANVLNSDNARSNTERNEKVKSKHIYEQRRGSLKPELLLGGGLQERPKLQTRTNSAPSVETRVERGRPVGNRNAGPAEGLNGHREQAHGSAADKTIAQDEDEVAGVVGAVKSFQPFTNPELSEPLPEINIAVIGAEGVGKSTYVQKALDLPYPAPSAAAERKIPYEGNVYLVRMLEMPIEDVDIDDDDETLSWPDTIENKMMPKVDAVVTLYDVTDKGSLDSVPEMLSAISKAALPSVLVSYKCDASSAERDVDPTAVEQKARQSISNLSTLQTSQSGAESHKRCLSLVLKAVLYARPDERNRSSSAARKRAQSNAVRPVSPRPPSHTRASSEYSASLPSLHKDKIHARHDSSLAGYGTSDRLKVPHDLVEEEMHSSFLFEESGTESTPESPRSSTSVENTAPFASVQSTSALSENGATFDELVDRLLAQPTSKADSKFGAIFLALYRKFAAPSRLLEAIVERFDALDRNGTAPMTRTVAQLRVLSIMEQWIGHYPGDFAYSKTRRRMRTFITKLATIAIFTVAAKEMSADLDAVQEDDDTNWAYSDQMRDANGNDSERWTISSSASTLIDDESTVFSDAMSSMSTNDDASIAVTLGTDTTRSASASTTSSQLMMNVEAAQRQARYLQPRARIPLTKLEWRTLMDIPDEIVAKELTRMDWIMFSSIRPRDLVRQVSLKAAEKAACKNLVNVNRMIEHFNQLAAWVANFILLRDKPKHRALMLEKLMRVARKVRELNNYNALGAIIAGIKSSSVHRLQATRELIPPAVGKDWLKLEILMAPSRSHFAYRLAWENSSSERIPYIPLHRRDLVTAEEGNKTFMGDEKDGRINWKKFEIMGDVIVSLQRAQGLPYRGLVADRAGEQVREFVLDVKLVKDEDELYELSTQLEPTAGSGGTSTRFKEFFKR